MKGRIIGLALLSAFALAWACDDSPYVSRDEFVSAQKESQQLRDSLTDLQVVFAKQNENLNYILSELASLSNRTSRVKLNAGEAPASQMDAVKEDLSSLKERIDALEKDSERMRKLDRSLAVSAKTIADLRETVANQEKEIARLQKQNQDHVATIRSQNTTISVQKDSILAQVNQLQKQKEELALSVRKQTELIYQAGVLLTEIADDGDFRVSGKRNKDAVRQYRLRIYEDAINMYSNAAKEGHQAARDSVIAMKGKIRSLK